MYLIFVLNMRQKEDEGTFHPITCHEGAGGWECSILSFTSTLNVGECSTSRPDFYTPVIGQ
jgi:hypothetical protein